MKNHVIALGLIVALGVITYSNSIHGSFHFDDIHSILENPSIRELNPGKVWNGNNRFRFVGFYSFALNYHISGYNDIRSWHYVNIGLHILCALLLYWALFFLIQNTSMPGIKIPLMASILFAVHPLCSEPVNYIQARHVLFYSMFTLSGLLWTIFFIKTRLVTGKVISAFGIAGCILLGALSKETGIFYVLATIVAYLFIFKWGEKKARVIFRPVIIFGIVAIIVVFLIMINRMYPLSKLVSPYYHPMVGELTCFSNILTEAQVFWKYVSLLIPLSSRLNVEHDVKAVNIHAPGEMLIALLSLFCIGAILIVILNRRQKNSGSCFLALWSILGILPYMLIPGTLELMVEYKAYLSAMGFIGLVAIGSGELSKFIRRRLTPRYGYIISGIVFSVLVIFCIKETRNRNMIWRTEFTLWNDAIYKSSEKARPYFSRGNAYKDKKEYGKAISDYNRALEIDSLYKEAYNNRGLAYSDQGKYDEGISDYNQALEIDSLYKEAYNNRGLAYSDQGEYARAISDYNRALEIDPLHKETYNNRGNAYSDQRKYTKAISDYNRVLEIDPFYKKAYNNRGLAYSDQGEYARAISDYNRALEIDPLYKKVYYNRAVAYFAKGDLTKAWEDVQKAQDLGYQINPEFLRILRKSYGRQQ